ncbi:Mobile element protein (plasmid) [Rhodococcus sp. WAY2]|nr:Mobile element protein [Rhodococcus sp. WAY2]
MKEQLQHVYSGSKKRTSVRLRAWVQMAQDSRIPEPVGLEEHRSLSPRNPQRNRIRPV